MYSIAICDDEVFTCSNIEQILQNYAASHNMNPNPNIENFYNGEKLIESLESGKFFDVIFLDIELLTISGVDIAKKVRNELLNESTQIIYISSKSSYAMQLFKTRPLDFLVKPIIERDIIEVFEQAMKAVNQGNKTFGFTVGRTSYRIPYKNIIYFRSIGRKIHLVLDQEELEFYGRLDKVMEQLPSWEFLQIHKSYIINYNNVIKYAYDTVVMKNDQVITISQAKRKIIREQLLKRKQSGNLSNK